MSYRQVMGYSFVHLHAKNYHSIAQFCKVIVKMRKIATVRQFFMPHSVYIDWGSQRQDFSPGSPHHLTPLDLYCFTAVDLCTHALCDLSCVCGFVKADNGCTSCKCVEPCYKEVGHYISIVLDIGHRQNHY